MWVRNIEGDADYFQQTANLSTNGMYILSPNPYEVGTVIDIEFQVPGTDYIIKCGAEILRCSEENQVFGLSAKFANMSDADIDRQFRNAEAKLGSFGFTRVYGGLYYDEDNPAEYKILQSYPQVMHT